MWTDLGIKSASELVKIVLEKNKLLVKKVFLIGSYAAGTATDSSDLDFLVELKDKLYPSWKEIVWVHRQLPERVHVIFGTERAQKRIGPYKKIGDRNALACSPSPESDRRVPRVKRNLRNT